MLAAASPVAWRVAGARIDCPPRHRHRFLCASLTMAMWNKDVYEAEEPVAEEKRVGHSYATKLRADANFAPSFAGLHLDGIRQRGTGGLGPQGSGADRVGIEDGGRTCRYWYDHLEIRAGSAARVVVDRGCEWRVVPPAEWHGPTYRGIPHDPAVVTVAAPRLEDGLDVVVFDVAAHAPGECTVVLRAREPEWFLDESRERRRQSIKAEKQQRKRDAVRLAKMEEARRLIYGDEAPPPEDEVDGSGETEIPPLWGTLFVLFLHFLFAHEFIRFGIRHAGIRFRCSACSRAVFAPHAAIP